MRELRYRYILGLLIALLGGVSCTDEPSDTAVDAHDSVDGLEEEFAVPDVDSGENAPDVQRFEGSPEVSCVPSCAGKQCGGDQCGGSCGFCDAGEVCSLEGICKELGELQGLGEACLPFEGCEEGDANWPNCLDALCASGECRYPVCTQSCGFAADGLNNHSGEPGFDGVEDEPHQSCGNGMNGPMGSSYRCVDVSANRGLFDGKCLPGTTFAACQSDRDCTAGERCGLLTVSGIPSLRCMGAVTDGLGTGEYCAEIGGLTEVCGLPSLCSGDGCTAPCQNDEDCVPDNVTCEDGLCSGDAERPCEGDGDCSPWRCRLLQGSELDDSGLEGVCEPRNCEANQDCRDSNYLCELRLGAPSSGFASWQHVCVLPNPEATLAIGDPCLNGGGDEPQCPEKSLCYKGVCSALCREDRDCSGTSNQVCAVAELPINLDGVGGYEHTLPLRVCETFVHEGKLTYCATDQDCIGKDQVCAPIELPVVEELSFPFKIQSICRYMNPQLGETGDTCGLNPGEGECQIGFCGIGVPEDPVSSMCSEMCYSSKDCGELVTEAGTFDGYCRASLYGWNNNIDPIDDLFASTCWPAPSGSSLNSCDPMTGCEDGMEVCTATLQASDPTLPGRVEWLCMERPEGVDLENLVALGGSCESNQECSSGRCRSNVDGKGYCTVSCETDLECLSAGPTMVCVDYAIIPRALGDSAIIRECRKQETCIPCEHHNDCFKGMRCIQTGGQSDMKTVCAYSCDTDLDCIGQDGSEICREGLTVDGASENTCAPNSCKQ